MGKQRPNESQPVEGGLASFLEQGNKGLKPLNPIPDKQFRDSQKIYDPVKNKDVKLSEYEKYIPNLDLDDSNLDARRAQGQSGWEQAANSLVQFGGGLVGGMAIAAGTSLDIEQTINTIKGTEKEYTNKLYEFGTNLMQKSAEVAPIYQTEPGKVNPADSGWWANMFGQTGLSAGIMAESALEAAAITALTGGAGLGAELAGAAKKLRNIKGIKDLMSVGNNATKLKTMATMFGVINRNHEAVIEAADAFQAEKEALMAKGFTEDKAVNGASKAAQATYLGNLPLMALDILQFRAMTFNPISGGSTGGLVEGVLSKIKSPFLAKAAGMTAGIAGESGEEFWQYLVQEESKNYADNASGVGSGKSFTERFKEYSDKGEMWNATISGAFGGVVLGGISKGLSSFSSNQAKKQLDKEHKNFINGMTGIGVELSNQIRQAEAEGNELKANNLRRGMGIQKALHAIHLDGMKDSEAAFVSYVDGLQNILDAANSGDAAQIEAMGITGSEEFVKQSVPAYLEDATKIKAIYDETKLNNAKDAVAPITYRKFLVDRLNEELTNTQANISLTESGLTDLSNVSPAGKDIYFTKLDIRNREEHLDELDILLADVTIPEMQKEAIKDNKIKVQTEIDFLKDSLEKKQELNKDSQDNLTDADILQNLDRHSSLKKLHKQKVSLGSYLYRTRKELNTWSDPAFQKKNKKAQLADIIASAETVAELDNIYDTMADQDILSDDIVDQMNVKKAKLSAQEEVSSLKTNPPVTVAPTPTSTSPLSNFISPTVTASVPNTPFGNNEPVTSVQPVSPERTATAGSLFTLSTANENPFGTTTITPTNPTGGTVVQEESLFEPAAIIDNLTDEQKEGIKAKLAEYYTSLEAELGRKPTAKELIEDMIHNTSAEQVEKNFNVIKLGWELNGFPAANFNQIYNDLFGDRKSKANDFFNYATQITQTEQEYKANQQQEDEKFEDSQTPPESREEIPDTGEVIFHHVKPFKTVESTLKMAHLSVAHVRTMENNEGITDIDYINASEELNDGEYVDSKELLNYDKYHAGTELEARVPENSLDIPIAQWNEHWEKGKAVPFVTWAREQEIDPNSDAYIGRMPMIIYNAEGKGVAFVHDIEWYNPSNLGLENNPTEQAKIIATAREELLAFRKAILANNGKIKITVTKKSPGTKYRIPEKQPLVTVNQANPQAMIGFPNDIGNMETAHGIIDTEQIINGETMEIGHRYDLRQVGILEDGRPQYFAAKVQYDKLDGDVRMSVAQAFRVYLAKFDTQGHMGLKEDIAKIVADVKAKTGLNLQDQGDLETYLNMFIQTYKGSAKTNEDIAQSIESNPAILTGTPYMAISSGRLIFGIKGKMMTGKSAVVYTHPNNLQSGTKVSADIAKGVIERIMKDDFLGAMTQNIHRSNLEKNTTVVTIDNKNQVKDAGTYENFLKDKFKTNIKSFDLGNGKFATFVQPVINFTYEGQQTTETEQAPTKSVAQIAQEAATETTGNAPSEEELIARITADLNEFEGLGLDAESLNLLRNLGAQTDQPLFEPDYAKITDELVGKVKRKITRIEELDTTDRGVVVQYIANEIMRDIDPQKRNTLNKKDLISKIGQSFTNLIVPKVEKYNAKVADLNKLYETGKYPGLKPVIDNFNILINNAEVLKTNWNLLVNEAFEKHISRFTGISVTMSKDQKTIDVAIDAQVEEETPVEEELTNQDEEVQENQFEFEGDEARGKNFSKESIEDNGKLSVSYLVKRFLAQIPNYDRTGAPQTGFMGITTYPGFDHYYNLIGNMLSSPRQVESNVDAIITRLLQHQKSQPWVLAVVEKLQNADQQFKNAFMYNFNRDTLSMKFVMYSHDSKSGKDTLKVYDTNANAILRVIQERWKENFKQSDLVLSTGEINSGKAKMLLETYTNWLAKKQLPTASEAKAWLAEFGIDVTLDTLNDIKTNGYWVYQGKKPVIMRYDKMFNNSDRNNGLFGRLANYLQAMSAENANLDYQENDLVNPFADSNGILNKLASIQAKYSLNVTTNSFRDNGKAIFGYTPSKYATSMVNMMWQNPQLIENKKKISFDKHAYLLDLFENDENFKTKFAIDHIGITAFKELGKKPNSKSEVTDLAETDLEVMRLGLFQDKKQGEVKSTTQNGIALRIGRMFFPTMADKKTMLSLTTAVMDLKAKDFVFSEGTVTLSDQVREFLFTQLIEPEFSRIFNHHRRAASLGINPNDLNNQKGYNLAAQIFNFIPEMNNLMYTKESGEEVRLIEFLANSANLIDQDVEKVIREKILSASGDLLNKLFTQLATDKVASWGQNGYITRDDKGEVTAVEKLDGAYISSRGGSLTENVTVAALDYILNTAVTTANVHMLIAGDVANYSQDKNFRDRLQKDAQGNVLAYKPVDNTQYSTIVQANAINLGKRLAMLIAPGATIADSKNDKYVQLFLQDRESVSENIEFLISLYHGQPNEGTKAHILEAKKGNKNSIKILSKQYPDLAAYFQIESTDAQEYTTSKEHLDILYRQGRMEVELYNSLLSKLATQREAENNNQPIPESAMLSDAELKIVFQPIKPVYSGQLNDKNNDVSRMLYIKSSSFPLIPQVTQAFTGLNKLRRDMEALEAKTGMNVRASYDTANKVGAVLPSNQLNIWNADGSYNEGVINIDAIARRLDKGEDTSALVLNREFFRIQQDVPFKSAKAKQDMVTLGTQMMKLMFGNGVNQIAEDIFEVSGQKFNGQQLQDYYTERFKDWLSNEKTGLYQTLGIDEATGQPLDKVKTMQKLQNLLQVEAKKRNYPLQDIEALELDLSSDTNNPQFVIPLWLSPNSNRYEALLNSIVTNRLLNLKLPGAAFVAGSEEGFKTSDDVQALDQSKVIFTSSWTGELKGTFNEDGRIKTAQVLVPSKLRGKNGQLLDLFQKNEAGEYIYVTQKENGSYRLKEYMIDMDLLSMSSFRIPTSSHVSMSQIEIVGILPVEMGDLIIVPKNFTKQKGLDFDVDKENVYMLHHTVDENGKIVKLEENEYGATVANIDKEIKIYEDYLQELTQQNDETRQAIQNYKDELDLYETYPVLAELDKKNAKRLIRELKSELVSSKDIKDIVHTLKDLKALKTKLNQNEIIKVYSAILSSSDDRVQKNINKVLSTEFAEEQAELISGLSDQGKDNSLFTILSDTYQKEKMELGAAGKLGISVYSNAVVLHSLIQQAPSPIQLMEEKMEGLVSTKIPFTLSIGGHVSDGRLGRQVSLDGDRSVTEVLAERQNTGTDNEKLQVMGKVNVNEITINIDTLLSLLGFDKTNARGKDYSVSYLLLSQPIIKEYVKLIRNTKSNLADYNKDAEKNVIESLRLKYNPDKVDTRNLKSPLSGEALVAGIAQNGADGVIQAAALDTFLKLKKFGETITQVQGRLNIQRQGLGKSMFEMIDKYDSVRELSENESISNVSSLVGDYVMGTNFSERGRDNLIAEGYTIFDDKGFQPYAVKPTTVTGALLINAAKSGFQLWSDYFPHQNPVIDRVVSQVVSTMTTQDTSPAKTLKLKHEVFGELKKYLYSSQQLGIFEDNPQQERARLFFDRDDNQSLISYIKDFIKSDHPQKNVLAGNKLISSFQYQLDKGELPSIIKFNNSQSEDFNEEYKYQALVELMDKNIPLADYNGKPYTSRMLAKDLISYAYLEGGMQEAIQFVKYVPVAYLKEVGFAEKAQLWQRAARGEMFYNQQGHEINLWEKMLGAENSLEVARFTKQYAQHNPQKLPKTTLEKVTPIAYDGKSLSTLNSFFLELQDEMPEFVSIYNKSIKKGKVKFQVYQFDGQQYNKIPTLGVFGMSEYSVRDNNVVPLVDVPAVPKSKIVTGKPMGVPIGNAPFKLNEGSLTNTLNEIITANIAGVSDVAKLLSPFIRNNIQLQIGVVNGGKSNASYSNNIITIDTSYLSNPSTTKEQVATSILHEFVHALTMERLGEYFKRDGTPNIASNLMPADVQRLHRLFQEVEKTMAPEIAEFKQWYAQNVGQLRNEDDRVLYAGMNIFEFTAMVMAEPAIQRKMAGIKYMSTDRSLLEQLALALEKILTSIGINFDANSVTAQAMSTIFKVIEESQNTTQEKPNNSTNFGIVSNDGKLDDLLNKSDLQEEDDNEPPFDPQVQEDINQDCIF